MKRLPRVGKRTPAYTTPSGAAYVGDCRELLAELPPESVQLVMTSPPFALRRQKAYGNPPAERYIEWFMPIAGAIRRVLRHDGSFVMELGGAWNEGQPTRSLMPYALLLQMGQMFHLAQDFYWWNTRRLPTPNEWVNKCRERCKEAVTMIWWLSKSPRPYANNRQVLTPYKPHSRDMRHRSARPSGHLVYAHTWLRDNGGAIPPNIFQVAGCSRDDHSRACDAAGLSVHPARMPPQLPRLFIGLCTRPGDVVLDPFGGSNTTGQVAEELGRRWITMEQSAEYVAGSRLRFADTQAPANGRRH